MTSRQNPGNQEDACMACGQNHSSFVLAYVFTSLRLNTARYKQKHLMIARHSVGSQEHVDTVTTPLLNDHYCRSITWNMKQ